MKLLEKILVPTDFSPAAEDAVQTALFVAKQFNSEICLLHVMPGTVDFCSDVQGIFIKKIDDRLQEIAAQIRAEGIQDVETVVDHGVPFDLIDQHATQRNVNVIIMGAGNSDDGPIPAGHYGGQKSPHGNQTGLDRQTGRFASDHQDPLPGGLFRFVRHRAEECDSSARAASGRVDRAYSSSRLAR